MGAGLSQAQPQTPCNECASVGLTYLAQGIALFDAKNHKQAERALQAALYTGLPNTHEQAVAHKYLGFLYCLENEKSRCESAFSEMLALQPTFQLADHEAGNPAWRSAYFEAKKRSPNRDTQSTRDKFDGMGDRGPKIRTKDIASESNVRLRVAPWASVQVNGKQIGITPPVTRLKLQPGSYAIRLSNPGFKPIRKVVKVVKGETVTVAHDFETR